MKYLIAPALALFTACQFASAADQPQWGQAWSRNMVSAETNLPDTFDPNTGANVKWVVPLGTQTYSTPIVADGRVYIGTNNEQPRDPNHTADSGVLLCLDEKTGRLLWQLVVPKREADDYFDWPKTGMPAPVTVEGNRVYTVSNRGEVLCLDASGMANGNDGPYQDEAAHMMPLTTNTPAATPPPVGPQDADILWLFNLTSGAGIWSHDGAHSSILILGDYLYVNTSTGVDRTHKVIRTPDAPSLVAIDKRTGKYVARDDEHIAPNIFHNTWCSPSLGQVNGRTMIFFGAGNGILYAFEPYSPTDSSAPSAAATTATPDPTRPPGLRALKKIWQLTFDTTGPTGDPHPYLSNRKESPSNLYGMPVLDHGRLYIAGGGDIWWGKNHAWLKCIDPAAGTGDITTNGVLWTYPLERHVLGTTAVYDGMVFLADCGRKMHCVDAVTGKPFWTQEIKGEVWGSPMVADGKVYLGTREGEYWIFAAAREKQVLSQVKLSGPINATTTVANETLFIATMNKMYAVRKGEVRPAPLTP